MRWGLRLELTLRPTSGLWRKNLNWFPRACWRKFGLRSIRPVPCSDCQLSIPPPHAVGVAVLHLRRHIGRLAVADGAEHGNPVQQLAADIAGFQKLMLRRFGDEPVG